MRASICIASLALFLAAGLLQADDGHLVRQRDASGRLQLSPVDQGLRKLVGSNEAALFGPGTTTTQRIAEWLLQQRRRGDGGGGTVDDIQAVQTDYSDPTNGNVVLLIWTEENPNLADISVSVVDENGQLLLQGSVPAQTGANNVPVRNLPEGLLTFVVEGNGDPGRAETEMMVLADQPFADVTNFTCTEGQTNDAGNCDIILTWDTPTPLPSEHWILIDSTPGDAAGPDILGITNAGSVNIVTASQVISGLLPPGAYEMTNLGFLETEGPDDNLYRGGFVTTSCTLECSDLTCLAPVNLSVCQGTYPPATDNQLRVSWTNLSDYVGIDVFIDDALAQDLQPDAEGQLPSLIDLDALPPGDHTIGLQAVCPGNLAADLVEATITVLDATPHTDPIVGNLSCEFVLGDPAANPLDHTVTTWTNADPSVFFDIWVEDAASNRFFLGPGAGNLESVTINNTTPADTIFLQFYRVTEDGNCYGSDFYFCQPAPAGNIFIRGGCDGGGGTPQITSAVFGLDFLFGGGGTTPPCVEACDTNADGTVNISDMVQILNFLFGGGAPPAGWPDVNGACETATVNCETGLESCPL